MFKVNHTATDLFSKCFLNQIILVQVVEFKIKNPNNLLGVWSVFKANALLLTYTKLRNPFWILIIEFLSYFQNNGKET